MEKPTNFYSKKVYKSNYPLSHGTYFNIGDKTLISLAGCIPANSEGKFVGGDAITQATACMENIKNSLEEVNATFRDIFKVIIYVSDMADVPEINKAYGKYFEGYNGYYPSRCCFAVKELPLKAKLEIEVMAVVPKIKF